MFGKSKTKCGKSRNCKEKSVKNVESLVNLKISYECHFYCQINCDFEGNIPLFQKLRSGVDFSTFKKEGLSA
jgi:hypothetical protein